MADDVRIEDLYRLILEFRGDLREAVAKMDERHGFYTEKLSKNEADITEAHNRIRTLEGGHIKTSLIAGVFSGLLAAVVAAAAVKFFVGG